MWKSDGRAENDFLKDFSEKIPLSLKHKKTDWVMIFYLKLGENLRLAVVLIFNIQLPFWSQYHSQRFDKWFNTWAMLDWVTGWASEA